MLSKTRVMPKSFALLSGTLLLLLSFILNDVTEAQARKEQTPFQHEVKVVLKLIQVYVTDNKGNPVLDLKKENFIVYDNGKKQTLTEFEKHVLSLPGETKELKQEEIIETPASAARELMPRKFFLFFDFAYNNGIGIEKAKRAALHFIDTQLQPTDEVGVLSYSAIKSLTLHEYLTTNHQKVHEIVRRFGMENKAGRAEDFEAEYWSLLISADPPEGIDKLKVESLNPIDASKPGYVFDPKKERSQELELIKQQRESSELQAYQFVHKITDLAKALRYVPGHKSIIFFSSGIPYSLLTGIIPPQFTLFSPTDPAESLGKKAPSESGFKRSQLSFRYEDMLKELSAANCAFYALDTQEQFSTLFSDLQTRGALSLQQLTSATGGKYFGNINNYEQHLNKIQDLTGCYYVVGYYIDEQWDGDYHKIRVEVDRPGCKVHAQKGYFNPQPFKEYSDLEKMLHLVDLALSERALFQTPLNFPLKAIPYAAREKQNLALFSKITKEKIQELAGKKVEVVTVIFDKQENMVKMEREETDFSKLPEGNTYFSSLLSLKPGEYKCRQVIRNLESGRGAVARASVIIPQATDYGIKLSSPVLLTSEKDAFYFKAPSTAFPFDLSQYSPLVEELEQGTKSLFALVRCSFAGIQQAEIRLLANLLLSQADTAKAIPVTISILDKDRENDAETFLLEIQTEQLEQGEYFLYFLAKELKTRSNSQVNTSFKVK